MGEHEMKMEMIQKLMLNEHFRAFIAHPKTQELFRDPEFKEVAQSRDFARIMAHPKFMELARDPELSQLLVKITPPPGFGGFKPPDVSRQ